MMKHYKLFIFIGFVIFILPFLGVPQIFKDISLFIFGLVLLITGLLYRNWYKISNNNSDSIYKDNSHSISEDDDLKYEEDDDTDEPLKTEIKADSENLNLENDDDEKGV